MILPTDQPTFDLEEERHDYARILVGPLPRGFAHTLGNSLRRVLLGRIRGAAITWVRIDQVQHEFSTVPAMKEDTTEFLLNLREVRLRALADQPAELQLNVNGPAQITAADIAAPGDYEIVNPEHYLATLDSDVAQLNVTMKAETGYGFQPSEEVHSADEPIGLIPLDAVFTPIRKASYRVQQVSGGQASGAEELLLEVWTNGAISGKDAIQSAAVALQDELKLFTSMGQPPVARALAPHARVGLSAEQYSLPIEELKLSVRAHNCLKRSGLMVVGQILEKSDDELLTLRNFGEKSYIELIEKLHELNLLDDDDPRVRRARDGVFAPVDDTPLTSLPPLDEPSEPGVVADEPGFVVGAPEATESDEEVDETTSALGAALLEALRQAGEAPDE